MTFAPKIQVTEVCPRDGWQNWPKFIPTDLKVDLIKRMIDCGPKTIEVTSFVNPKAVPQMADAAEVVAGVAPYARAKGVEMMALALNKKGVDNARAAGLKSVSFVVSASEEHNRRNANRTIADSLNEFRAMAAEASDLKIQLAIPCAFGSPFGDEVPVDRIIQMCEAGLKAGAADFGLADTAGIAAPNRVRELLQSLRPHLDFDRVSLHLHDTYGRGLANAYVGMEEGVSRFDAALAGMGGCPFVPGARGNIATEDLLALIRSVGLDTDYDPDLAVALALDMATTIEAPINSSLGRLARVKSQ